MKLRARAAAFVLGALVLGSAVGCSSSGGTAGSTAPTASASALCSDYQALKASLASLATINVIDAGVSGLKTAISDVTRTLAALKTSAQQQYAPQIDQLTRKIDQLNSTLSGLGSGSSSSGAVDSLPTIKSELAAIGTAGRTLLSAVKAPCPTSSSS